MVLRLLTLINANNWTAIRGRVFSRISPIFCFSTRWMTLLLSDVLLQLTQSPHPSPPPKKSELSQYLLYQCCFWILWNYCCQAKYPPFYSEVLKNQAAVAWLRWYICRDLIKLCYLDACVCVCVYTEHKFHFLSFSVLEMNRIAVFRHVCVCVCVMELLLVIFKQLFYYSIFHQLLIVLFFICLLLQECK